jgi:hypothetical protein
MSCGAAAQKVPRMPRKQAGQGGMSSDKGAARSWRHLGGGGGHGGGLLAEAAGRGGGLGGAGCRKQDEGGANASRR